MNKFGFERLSIKKNYENFPTFYKETKDIIYRKIIDTYENARDSGKETQTLIVTARIENQPFDTDFPIIKSDPGLLMSLIPYFESIEDYETCERIMKLYSELKS
jgi:hypothetical protein